MNTTPRKLIALTTAILMASTSAFAAVKNGASLKGNEYTKGGNNVKGGGVIAWNSFSSVDPTAFSHDLSSETLTVLKDGDYLVAVTVPIYTFNGQRNTQRADLLVNGTAAPTGVGESSYIRWANNHSEASDHFAVLVALKADDKLTVKTTPTAATGTTGFISTCSLYAELVEGDRNVFSASATEIQSGTNLNVEPDIGDQGLVWTSARKGSGYTHSDGEAGITIKDDGNYMVYANVPLRGNIARGSVGLTINLDDDYIEGARGQQGYIRDANNHKDSSIHFSGIIRAEAGQVLTVTTEQLALAGTVNVQADRAASIFIEKLRNDGLFSDQFTTTTAGENMNPANKTALALDGDGMSLEIIDNLSYSNEGDNEENIVIKKAGDYLLTFNVTLQSSGGRVNPRFTVDVNGVEVPGATSTSHYIRNENAHNESTGSFVALLSDLAVDDVVTVNTAREGNTQAVTSPEGGKVALQAKASYSAAAGDTSPPKLSSIIGLGLDGFEAKIEDFGLSVDDATIKAVVDGAESTVTTSKIGSITTITYAFASFPVPFSSHSVSLTYSDSAGNSYTKDFSFTVDVDYKSLPASFASTSVDKSAAGFIANVTQISTIQTESAAFVHGSNLAGAEKQLAGLYLNPNEVDDDDNPLPYLNEADPDAWEGWSISPVEVDGVINWNQDEGGAIGNFGEDQSIPQIPGWGDSADGIVAEILGYLELSKGLHTLGVFSDDGFKLSFGPNPKDQLGIIAGQYEGWGQDVIFNIVAEADGLYPVRLLWYEAGGGTDIEFFSVDDKGTKILINDPDNADAIKAYRTADTAPYISRVAPAAGELSRTIEFDFINGDLSVVKSSVKMKFNGEDVTISTSSTDDGISVVYDHGDYLPAGTHTVELSYSESGGVDRVRNYSITIPKGRVDILMDKPKVTIEFDDLTGDAAAGAVGNPDAHYINGPELGVAALYPKGVGTAVRFDGSKNTDLRITDHADINVTNGPWEERTWEFWFKPEQLPEAGAFGILFQEGGATRGINIYLYGTEDDAEPNLYMMAWNRAETLWGGAINQVGGDNITAVTARVTVGNVNHLVLVMDGDASGDLEGTLTGYLNGQQVGQVSGVHMLYNHGDDTSFGNLWTNSVNHTGNGPGTGGMGFTGVIDDASFYSTALSAEQVQTHFQGGFGDWTTAEIEAWLTAGPDIPLLQSKSPTGAAAEGEETEISVSFRGIDFTDLSITVNDTAVDPTITSEGGFSTITAAGAFSLGQNVITVSWNGESETWNFYQFSVTESLTGLASYSVETVGAVPGPWEFKDGVWVSDGSVAGCGGPYHDFLTSPDYTVSADGEVTFSFEHRHAFEGAMWDSGQLWISVNGGDYTDVGKDAFSVNGYTDVAIIGNGIAKGQNGFGNTSAGHADGSYITTIASLGSFSAGDAISVRFVALYDDCATGAKPNWEVAGVSSDQMAIESIALPVNGWIFSDQNGETAAPTFGDAAGTLSGGVEWSTEDPFGGGGSVSFNGTDGTVVMEDLAEAFNGLPAFSLSMWIKANDTGIDKGFWEAVDSGGGDLWGLRYDSTGASAGGSNVIKLGITTSESGGNTNRGEDQQESHEGTQTTEWQHIVMTWEDGVGFNLYIDGVLDEPTLAMQNTVGTTALMDRFVLGDGAKAHWDGLIDEVAVWASTLTAGNAAWLAKNSIEGLAVDPDPVIEGELVAHWPMNEGSGDVFKDVVGGFDGLLPLGQGGAQTEVSWGEGPPTQANSVEFSGANSFIATSFPGIGGANPRTVAFWVRTTDADAYFVSWGPNQTAKKWHIRANGASGVMRTEYAGGQNFATTSIIDGEWHHVASVVPNGATEGEQILHYIDGVLDPRAGGANQTIDTGIPTDAVLDWTTFGGAVAYPVHIGARMNANFTSMLDGSIADVRIYNYGLSEDQIRAIFQGKVEDGMNLEGPTIVDFGDLSGDASYEFFFKAIKAGASTAIAGNNAFAFKLDQWNQQGVFGTTVFGVADNVFTAVEGKSVESVFDRDVHVVLVNDTAAGETRLYVDGAHVGVLAGNFELAGEGKVMGARIEANTDPMGDGSVMHKWATYDNALTDEQIAGLADEVAPLPDLVDISQPGDAVVASSDNSPGGEQASNAIDDNDQTKYLNFDGANNNASGLTITTAGGVVTGLGLTSANDAPDRDPATFVLSGSNDGGATLTEIASGDVPAFGARFERQEVRFANDAAYTTYELIFPTTTGPSTCCMQIAEIELLGTPADVPETPAPAELPWSVGLNDDAWPAGDGGGPNTTFVQESGVNELPGNPANAEVAQQGDDDYYWAGDYSTVIAGNGDYTPVGLVEVNEESAERAFAGVDNDLRYHFNLPESLEPTDRLTVSYDALNLHTGEADSRYGIEVYVNNVQVQSEIVIREAELGQTYATDPFTLADVNAEVGSGYDNIITLKGVNYNAEGGGNWMGIDYVQLSKAAPVPGLIAHFPLDSDGNSSDGGFAASKETDVVYGSAGANANTGTSATFNGASSVIQHDWSADLNPESFTLALWARSDGGAGAWHSPVTSRNDKNPDSQGYLIYDNNPNGVWTFWSGNGTVDGNWQALDGPAVNVGEWEHVAITYDNESEMKRLYVNGELAVEANDSVFPNDTTPFNIGAGQDMGTGFWFKGDIDDIGLWNIALSQEDIQGVMNNGVVPGDAPAPASEILVDFGGAGEFGAGASPDPWITIDNLVMDQAASLGGGVTITALDDGFNPNNPAQPGEGAEYDGVSVPQEARNDYLFKIADAAGTTARMRIDGLAAGTYNVTVFEGRTTDASQFAKIWTGEEPAAENTGDFAKASATVTVTVGAGESLWYMHLEDGSGGVSGMMIRQAADTPALSIVNNGDGSVTVTFEGTLQAANSVNGPWADVEGAVSPQIIPASEAMQFGRAVK